MNEVLDNERLISEIDSKGIKDAKEIISEYIEMNEKGLAYEHLEYVVSECGIKLKDEQVAKLNSIAEKLK